MSDESLAAIVLRYESVDSTSDEARRLLLGDGPGPALPFVVWADRQTRGRGRGRRSWWSDEGSLTFTVALDPSALGLRRDHEPRLALIAGLAILDTLDALKLETPGIGIRWPNDVEIGDRKLAGLLPEPVETASGRRILIGIGLNLSTRFDEAPSEIARMAVSLTSLGLDVPAAGGPGKVLERILDQLGILVRLLAADDPGLVERWNRIDLLRGRRVRIDLGPRIIAGTVRGIGPDGSLMVAPDDGGTTIAVMGGQVLRDRPLV
jgi:BirA family biotin operon repressor/biotin-[acetyl-CoA-carboxylase] ligase